MLLGETIQELADEVSDSPCVVVARGIGEVIGKQVRGDAQALVRAHQQAAREKRITGGFHLATLDAEKFRHHLSG